jgi:hypothetical protein
MAVKQLSDGGPDGVKIGQSASDLVGFHGATPSDQRASLTAVTTTAAVTTTPHGYTTGTQADAIVTAINEIIACLKEKGLMASS